MICFDDDVKQAMIEFAKLHVKAALLAAKNELLNSNIEIDDKAFDKMGEVILDLKCQNIICKNILKVYPDKNIK